MDHNKAIGKQRQRRRYRVRKRLRGTPARPRLCVSRSHRHISAQLIDDEAAAAAAVGAAIAERAAAVGVKQVCFDRGSAMYHGRVAALAEAARSAGLEF